MNHRGATGNKTRSVCVWHSVLWRCWLGGRKGIRPVKAEWWGAGVVICLQRGADMHTAQLMPMPLTVSCFIKSRLVLPFWYRLTRVVLDKGPLNGCVCVSVCVCLSQVEFYRNRRTDQASFWHADLLRSILCCVEKKLRYPGISKNE